MPSEYAHNVNQHQTFLNFIVGKCNEHAFDVCVATAQSPREKINPIFIVGESNTGKTHLLNAMAFEIKKNNPYFRIWHLNKENLYSELFEKIKGITNRRLTEEYLEQYDALFFEDISMLKILKSTQVELCHVANEFIKHKKQVVITSDHKPGNSKIFDSGIKNLINIGLITVVTKPDLETRIKASKCFLHNYNIKLSQNNLYRLVKKSRRSLAELRKNMLMAKLIDDVKTIQPHRYE
jgi:chromosomal replication initiator protein